MLDSIKGYSCSPKRILGRNRRYGRLATPRLTRKAHYCKKVNMPRHTHSGVIITDFCEVPAEKDCVRKQWDAPYLGGGGYAKALQLPKHSHPHCWIASRMIRCIRQPPYIMGAAQHGVGWDQLHPHEPGGSPEAQLIAKKQGEVRLQSA